MQNNENPLGTEPVGKLLFKLAVPTLTAQIINMLYNLVDRIYIGNGVGALALTGVGVCMPIIMVVSAFAALVSAGGAPRASIAMGRQDNDSAEEILGGCFFLQILVSAVLTAVLLLWNRPLLMAFGASPDTIGYAVSYMNIYAVGTVFVQLTLGMNAFITAQGFTKTSMLSVLIGAASNIVLDPVFIFGFHMGVRGAALATILSQCFSCIWVLCFLFGHRTQLKIRAKYLRFTPKVIFPCLALGLAPFIMQASESVISICFNRSLQFYGGDIAVTAMTILSSVMQFAMLPLQGIGQGAQPIMSYNYGARNGDRVRRAFRLLLKTSLIYSTLLWAAVMFFPRIFISIFNSEPALLAFTVKPLRVYIGALCIFGAQIACQMGFNSLGNAKASILVAVMRKFILLLPLIYIMPRLFPADPTFAIYVAEPVADTLSVLFTVILFRFQFRRAMAELESPTPTALN